MISRRTLHGIGLICALLLSAPNGLPAAEPPTVTYRQKAWRFADLPGWADDRHDEAYATLRRSCAQILSGVAEIRIAKPADRALEASCRRMMEAPATLSPQAARAWFETEFSPYEVLPRHGAGFMTGYYEPEFPGSLARTPEFVAPALSRPDDLVPLQGIDTHDSRLNGLVAARRRADGVLVPYADRAMIEDGALDGRGLELVWLNNPFDVFIAQVQGSARIRLRDGRVLRLGYAARNGHPYHSIARTLIDKGLLTMDSASLPAIRALFSNDQKLARDTMRTNPSYVFFRLIDTLTPELGPIGAQGIALTPGRSIAIDRNHHAYGTSFYLVGALPDPNGGARPLQRTVIAQDTGSAILGPARIDYFAGWGAEAERIAGTLKAGIRLFVLRPNRPVPP